MIMGRMRGDIIASAGIIIAMFFFLYKYHGNVNVDSIVASTLFTLLPGFIIIAACVYVTAEGGGVGVLGGSMGVGIGLCYLLNVADGEGLITVEMLSGLTVPQIQIWTMIIATLLGTIMYATNR